MTVFFQTYKFYLHLKALMRAKAKLHILLIALLGDILVLFFLRVLILYDDTISLHIKFQKSHLNSVKFVAVLRQ